MSRHIDKHRRTIEPSDMLLFAAVVREGGFTRAAAHLGLPKQTVSGRIARLEAALGVRLLERTTRRVRVTDAGGQYYERCVAIGSQIGEANAEVQRRRSEPVGRLRISAPVLLGRRFLGPVVADYLERYPEVQVEVSLADRRVDLVEEGLDLAIRVGDLEDSSLAARKLGEASVVFAASPAFLARHGAPSPDAPSRWRCVGVRPGETWEVGGRTHRVSPVLCVNDLELACEAAIRGIGIARLPSLVCREAVLDGRLLPVFGAASGAVRPIYALYPSRTHLPAKVRLFVEALVDGLGRTVGLP